MKIFIATLGLSLLLGSGALSQGYQSNGVNSSSNGAANGNSNSSNGNETPTNGSFNNTANGTVPVGTGGTQGTMTSPSPPFIDDHFNQSGNPNAAPTR